jgi:hypothetical protein
MYAHRRRTAATLRRMLNPHHIAQINIGRTVAPLDDPQLAGFVERLAEINALADRSPGFVWRLQTPISSVAALYTEIGATRQGRDDWLQL